MIYLNEHKRVEAKVWSFVITAAASPHARLVCVLSLHALCHRVPCVQTRRMSSLARRCRSAAVTRWPGATRRRRRVWHARLHTYAPRRMRATLRPHRLLTMPHLERCPQRTQRTLARLRSRGSACHAVIDTRVPPAGALASWYQAGAAGERRGASRRRADDGAHFDVLSSCFDAAREADSGGPHTSPLGQRRPAWSAAVFVRAPACCVRSVEVAATIVWLATLGRAFVRSIVTDYFASVVRYEVVYAPPALWIINNRSKRATIVGS